MVNFKKLTIVILSYNRGLNLSKIIFKIYNFVKKNNISLIILDDNSKFKINKIMKIFSNDYRKFRYIQNKTRIGHDENYLKAIKLCKTDYLWIVGDSFDFNIKKLYSLNSFLDNINDLIILKSKNRNKQVKNNALKCKNLFLENYSWHCCLLGSVIFSKKIFKNVDYQFIKKFKNFPQIGIIFSSLQEQKLKIKFYLKVMLSTYPKKSYWHSKVFDVFLVDWSRAIFNLDGYPLNSKIVAIKEHDKNVKVFGL